MEVDEKNKTTDFQRKVFTRYHSSISLLKADQEKPRKRIVPTTKKCGLREEFKKTFLPLLIDVFELRQMTQNFKSREALPLLPEKEEISKSPKEIIKKLEALQNDIEESKRWCEGVILQISKGIQEAKEALQFIDNSSEISEIKNNESALKEEKKPISFFSHIKSIFSKKKVES